MVIAGELAPLDKTSARVHVTVSPDIEHAQPGPVALAGDRSPGTVSVTVIVPFVTMPLFVTMSVNVPLPRRTNLDELAVLLIVRSGPPAMFTMTDALVGVVSPPPLTVA